MVCKLFLKKLHGLIKIHSIPSRYACAFALAASDSDEDIRENVWNKFLQMQVHIHRVLDYNFLMPSYVHYYFRHLKG